MSVRAFAAIVKSGEFAESDKKWFPAWLRRYAEFVNENDTVQLPLTRELAVAFSQRLRDGQVPAWQRRQAVRALMAYRDLVLQADEPRLNDMVIKLGEIAEREKQFGSFGAPGLSDERQLTGEIDPRESPILQCVRRSLRVQGKALQTERAYIGWIEQGADSPLTQRSLPARASKTLTLFAHQACCTVCA